MNIRIRNLSRKGEGQLASILKKAPPPLHWVQGAQLKAVPLFQDNGGGGGGSS